jgi:hypothetical protein
LRESPRPPCECWISFVGVAPAIRRGKLVSHQSAYLALPRALRVSWSRSLLNPICPCRRHNGNGEDMQSAPSFSRLALVRWQWRQSLGGPLLRAWTKVSTVSMKAPRASPQRGPSHSLSWKEWCSTSHWASPRRCSKCVPSSTAILRVPPPGLLRCAVFAAASSCDSMALYALSPSCWIPRPSQERHPNSQCVSPSSLESWKRPRDPRRSLRRLLGDVRCGAHAGRGSSVVCGEERLGRRWARTTSQQCATVRGSLTGGSSPPRCPTSSRARHGGVWGHL